jgi:phosphoserine phosphatase RsbX
MALIQTLNTTSLDYAVRVTPIAGEEAAGDTFVVKQFEKHWLLAVIDGLGHGSEAVQASRTAGEIISGFREPHLATIMAGCNTALKATRGAVVGLALIENQSRRLTWAGVGNIEGKMVWRGNRDRVEQSNFPSVPGVVGFNMPKIFQQVYTLRPDTLVIIFTDGLDDRWVFPENNWLFEMETEPLAEHLMKSYQKETDDRLVLVARC